MQYLTEDYTFPVLDNMQSCIWARSRRGRRVHAPREPSLRWPLDGYPRSYSPGCWACPNRLRVRAWSFTSLVHSRCRDGVETCSNFSPSRGVGMFHGDKNQTSPCYVVSAAASMNDSWQGVNRFFFAPSCWKWWRPIHLGWHLVRCWG